MSKLEIITMKEQGMSLRAIAAELKMGRRTVSKYWKDYQETKIALQEDPGNLALQEKLVQKPVYTTKKPKLLTKYTQAIDQRLDEILAEEQEKNKVLGPHKQKLTALAIHEIIKSEGHDIGRSTLTNYLKMKREKQSEVFIKQKYQLGNRIEFDFGEVKLKFGTDVKKYMLAVFSSPATSYRWARLYENANQAVFIDAHVQFFNHIGGVYKTVVYDNMRNVVSRFISKRKKVLNDELVKLSIFYGFSPVVTNPYRGNEKGHVENSVKTIRNKAFTSRYTFENVSEAQVHLDTILYSMNKETNIHEEQQYLKPIIDTYEYCTYQKLRVSKYSFIQLDTNFYSVPEYLVYKIVTVKKYLSFISVLHANTEVARHEVKTGFGEYALNIQHYLKTLIQKPGALPNSAALESIPALKRAYQMYYEGRERVFLSHLLTYKDYELDKLIQKLVQLGKDDTTTKIISHNKAVDAARIQLRAHSKLHMKEGRTK